MNPNLQSALANCAQLVGVCISALLVDSIGQRILWCLSAFSCFIFLILYALTLKISMPNYTPPLFIFYFRLGYGFGVGPITFAVWVQLFSDKLRLVGTSLMMTGYYIVIWALVYGHPYALEACGDFYTTLIYAICTFFSIFFGAFCIPDHRNKDNEDMALI
ncbi:hypothetical protein TRFO_41534 [Tritrichomonas foetus]|uniref:Major facilitator superfamily (MFS) profile domain-containing protein n=1 Tax=Tritrichomonas foetus TaxID=1144522 RepID=A0A1J4L014_9EUKA|nr:hypothetical protein TRFO_41534 [Tritrichomonas foetus]|eukprot:OHT16855.1 hypothetical protein TRFO_41534 [Tritrichomonas foetus]